MPTFQIGSGGRVQSGTAAAPSTATTDRTPYITSFSVDQNDDTAEITTLDCDSNSYAKSFIAALSTGTATANMQWDYPTGAVYRAFGDIKVGNNHSAGRGKVDFVYDPFGSTTGNLRLSFTAIITNRTISSELGGPVNGTMSLQIDGPVTEDVVP